MPRYFFHVQDGLDLPDEEGTELPDLKAAKLYAVRYSGDLISSIGRQFWEHGDWRMTVEDDTGLSLFCLIFNGFESAEARCAEFTPWDEPGQVELRMRSLGCETQLDPGMSVSFKIEESR